MYGGLEGHSDVEHLADAECASEASAARKLRTFITQLALIGAYYVSYLETTRTLTSYDDMMVLTLKFPVGAQFSYTT